MPYLNDRVNANKEFNASKKHEENFSRASRFRFSPDQVMQILRERIVGQESALIAIENMLFRVKADFSEPGRPLCVIFLRGPTGVGKTETVKILAECLRGQANRLCRIDMNTLSQDHYAASISGAPPGYVGSKEGQTLFEEEHLKGSFSEPGIVLFDEVEKASQSVIRALMNVFDSGKLRLSSGTDELDFTNTLVFLTSNIGAAELSKRAALGRLRYWFQSLRFSDEDLLDMHLKNRFDPEFINRLDQIITFGRLQGDRAKTLVKLEVDKLNRRLTRRRASIRLDPSVENYLCKAYDATYGARDIARKVRQELESELGAAMIKQPRCEKFFALIARDKNGTRGKLIVEEDSLAPTTT